MLGDDIGAVIVNVGRYETRVGEAGEDTPKSVIPSFIGVATSVQSTQDNSSGMDVENRQMSYSTHDGLDVYKEGMSVVSPFSNDRVDWDLYFKLVSRSFENLKIDPSVHPLMFTEHSYAPAQFRRELTQQVFERYKPPGFFLAKEATLSCYSSGRATSLVVDSGAHATIVCAVHDGYVLSKSIHYSKVAGDYLSESIVQLLAQRNKAIAPHYSFTKKKVSNGKWQVTPNKIVRNESFHNFHVRKTVNEIKMLCKIPDRLDYTGPKQDFELPDGSIIALDSEILYSPDYMFKTAGEENSAVQQMVTQCIGSCDVDIKKDLCGGVIVVGGNTLFPGFEDKLQRSINVPSMYKLKVIASADSADRRFSSWIGGSILGSLGSMHAMWISKAEYDEIGAAIVDKKCP
jgi:actin-like protein 6A